MREVGSRLIGDPRDQLFSAQVDEIAVCEYLETRTLKRFSGPTLYEKGVERLINFFHGSFRYRLGQNSPFLLLDSLFKARTVVNIFRVFGHEVAVYYSSPAAGRIIAVSVSVLSVCEAVLRRLSRGENHQGSLFFEQVLNQPQFLLIDLRIVHPVVEPV